AKDTVQSPGSPASRASPPRGGRAVRPATAGRRCPARAGQRAGTRARDAAPPHSAVRRGESSSRLRSSSSGDGAASWYQGTRIYAEASQRGKSGHLIDNLLVDPDCVGATTAGRVV